MPGARRRSSALPAVVAAALLTACAPVAAETVTAKTLVETIVDAISIDVYGQVNRAFVAAGDGDDTYFLNVDNDASSTRFGIRSEAAPSDALTVGTRFELQFESNSSSDVGQNAESGVGKGHFTERHLDVYFDSPTLGRLSLGQGDTATNLVTEVDLSGTKAVAYGSRAQALAGGMWFFDDGGDTLAATRVKNVVNNMDGFSRDDRVRYDTPEIFGFTLSASAIAGGSYDAALRYDGELPGLRVGSALGYAVPDDDDGESFDEQLSGSISVLLDLGLSATFAAGERSADEAGRDDATFYFGKLGYTAHAVDVGATSFAVDYGVYRAISADDEETATVGVSLVQRLDDWKTELYAGFRTYELTWGDGDDGYEPVTAFMLGAKVSF